MLSTVPKKNSLLGARFPFGNLVAVLEGGSENIGGSAENVNVFHVGSWYLGPR
jgi:hypothetical protein